MKSALTSLALLAASVCQAAPELVWLNPIHNFGAFNEEMGPVTCRFRAVNTGDEPVVVIDARANCGCTRPDYPRSPVAPGDTLTVSVAYNPEGRPGRFHKQVKVTTNAKNRSSVLSIRGTVIGAPATLNSRYPKQCGAIRFNNDICAFGETVKGHVLASAVQIYNPTADTIIPAVEQLPRFINVVASPKVIPPGEQGIISLTAYTDRADGYGLIEDSFVLVPDSRRPENKARISTVMIVNEDFSKLTDKERNDAPAARLSEESVDFGTITPGSGKITRSFTITNTGATSMLVRRLYTPDKSLHLSISHEKIKPGKTATVTVTLDTDSLAGRDMLNSRITFIANTPDNPTRIIRVVGEIVR